MKQLEGLLLSDYGIKAMDIEVISTVVGRERWKDIGVAAGHVGKRSVCAVIEPIELNGTTVKLVPMRAEHADALYRAGCHAEIWDYMPIQVHARADMDELVQKALEAREAGTEFPFVICLRESEEVVGSTRFLDISLSDRHLEIGWTWLTPKVWRSRVNTECKYLLLAHCFETLDMVRVQIKADARNTRSLKAIERIGAVREGVLRKHRILPDGFVRDSVYYSILDTEWPAVKARLEQMR